MVEYFLEISVLVSNFFQTLIVLLNSVSFKGSFISLNEVGYFQLWIMDILSLSNLFIFSSRDSPGTHTLDSGSVLRKFGINNNMVTQEFFGSSWVQRSVSSEREKTLGDFSNTCAKDLNYKQTPVHQLCFMQDIGAKPRGRGRLSRTGSFDVPILSSRCTFMVAWIWSKRNVLSFTC